MLIEFPEVAGGRVSATLATGDNAQDVRGCKLTRTGTGVHTCLLSKPIPLTKQRCFTQNMSANVPTTIIVNQVAPTVLTINTYTMANVVDDDPVSADLTLTLANFAFCFSVSEIPE